MAQYTYNGVTYRSDEPTLDRLIAALTEALTSLDYTLVGMVIFLGLRSGRMTRVSA